MNVSTQKLVFKSVTKTKH